MGHFPVAWRSILIIVHNSIWTTLEPQVGIAAFAGLAAICWYFSHRWLTPLTTT
jgi:hypothetical protein